MPLLLARIFGGIFSSLGGVFFLYQFLANLQGGSNFLFLLLFVVLIGVAVFLLVTGAKSAERILSGADVVKAIAEDSLDGVDKMIERNNAISSEWNKTENERSRIETLQLQVNADKES